MAETYASFTSWVKKEATINDNDTDFVAIWPSKLLSAELRIFRDLDPLVGRKYQQVTLPATLSLRAVIGAPVGCLVMRELWYFTPVGTTTRRNPIERREEGFVKDYWPDRSLTGSPRFFAEIAHNQILTAPTANDTYRVEMGFTYRPVSLAVATPGDGSQTTYLSTTYPDLLLMASMVEVAGFKKNYGAMADDPKEALSWEGRYQATLAAAKIEEGRRKSGAYADESPSRPPERNAVQ